MIRHALAESNIVKLVTTKSFIITLFGAVIGGLIFGTIGWLAEAGVIGIPRLTAIFDAPYGVVTLIMRFRARLRRFNCRTFYNLAN